MWNLITKRKRFSHARRSNLVISVIFTVYCIIYVFLQYIGLKICKIWKCTVKLYMHTVYSLPYNVNFTRVGWQIGCNFIVKFTIFSNRIPVYSLDRRLRTVTVLSLSFRYAYVIWLISDVINLNFLAFFKLKETRTFTPRTVQIRYIRLFIKRKTRSPNNWISWICNLTLKVNEEIWTFRFRLVYSISSISVLQVTSKNALSTN